MVICMTIHHTCNGISFVLSATYPTYYLYTQRLMTMQVNFQNFLLSFFHSSKINKYFCNNMMCHMRLHNLIQNPINIMLGLILMFNHFNNNLFICQGFNQLNFSNIWINPTTCHSNRVSINNLSIALLVHQISLSPPP